ncbi:PP2C family protein-serine/threonine phosphatase [Treponema sp. C6A8]|uniref:PP2C family protein-serine/threonine phosphatase n=1 Tax=Treponema sp. C6A8 TaxID=1410609 RepID=UPI0004872085|nr:PP2C family protein-serine/threonine phosphatase [Treponema sp. C6A8]
MLFNLINQEKLSTPHGRSELIAFFTTFFALIYHIAVLIIFGVLHVYPMFFFNIFSVSLFTVLLILIPKHQSYVLLYLIASVEVTIHQIFAEYCLGSYTSFKFFIFLIGTLPYLIFEKDFKISAVFTAITTLIFFTLCFVHFQTRYIQHPNVLLSFRMVNVILSLTMIIVVILLYTYVVHTVEEELKKHGDNLEKEIRLAAFIQQNFYRHDNVEIEGWEIAYYNRPLAGVSGDLYDFYETNDGVKGLGIFDVSGHGISSGLVTMLVKNIIQQEFNNLKDLELWEVMNTINDRVIAEKGKIQNYLTGILIRIKGNQLEIVNAGHPYPIVYRKQNEKASFIEKAGEYPGGSIGIAGFPVYYYSQFVTFARGDEIVLYTDGISDSENHEGERFITRAFMEQIDATALLPVNEQVKAINRYLKQFRSGKEINDDMTMIIMRKK